MNSSFRSYLVNFAIFPRKLECKDRGGNVRVNYWFDTLLDELYKADVADVSVVENVDLEFEDDESVVDEAEDTLTILSNYIDTLNIQKNKKELDNLIRTLYNEALDYEITA